MMAVTPQPKLVEVNIPDTDEFVALNATMQVLKKYFPEVYEQVQSKVPGWIAEVTKGGGRDADQIRDDIFRFSVGVDRMVDVLGINASTANKIIAGKNEGGLNFSDVLALPKVQDKLGVGPGQAPEGGTPAATDADPATLPGVLKGGKTLRVNAGGGNYRWYQIYELPPGSGNYVSYQFSDLKQAEATLGKGFDFAAQNQAWYNQHVSAESQSEEITGLAGNWNAMSREIMLDAARAAGLGDPSLVGRMAADPEMQKIMALATVGDWTPEQILAEQRKTKFWQDTLYPGIQAFYGRTTEPERAWNNYHSNVRPALVALGYKPGPDGFYDDQIRGMLAAGIDDQVFLENVPVFQQAIQNKEYFEVYRQRAAVELGKDIKFGDWFAVLKGEAAPELMKVAEGATVAYVAKQADFGLQEDMLQRLIGERDMSEQEARNVFSEVNQAVLALGDAGLARGGLNRDDILSAAAGIAPTSGLNQDEVKLKVAKIAQENDLFDEQKVNFYLGFDASGRPTRPGLQPLRGEGA